MAKEDKRKSIIKAAEKLFLKRRFHEVTLDEVAKMAKVGKGTIYLHFRDKDDLFLQSTLFGIDELSELLHQKLPEDANFNEKLIVMSTIIYNFFKSRNPIIQMHRHILGKLLSSREETHQLFENHRKKVESVVSQVLSEGVEQGLIRSDIDISILSRVLVVTIRTSAGGPAAISEELLPVSTIVNIFLNGAGTSTGNANMS